MKQEKFTVAEVLTVLQALANGKKFAYHAGNREIDYQRLKALRDSLCADNKKKFTSEIIVVPARLALGAGIKIYRCLDSSEILSSDPDVDDIYVIIDGQHRFFTIMRFSNEKLDANVHIRMDLQGEDLQSAARNYNICAKTWDKASIENYNRETGMYNASTIAWQDASKNIQSEFVVKEKVASFMLHFKKDLTRKSGAVEGQNISQPFSESSVKRATDILKALFYQFPDENSIKTVQGLEFVPEARNQSPDELVGQFGFDMPAFIATMDENVKAQAIKLLKDKNYKAYTDFLVSEFQKFQAQEEQEKRELYAVIESDVEDNYNELKKKSTPTSKPLSISERIALENELTNLKKQVEGFGTRLSGDKAIAIKARDDYKKANKSCTPAKDSTYKELNDKVTSIKKVSSDFNSCNVQFKKKFNSFDRSKTASEADYYGKEVKQAFEPIEKLIQDYN